jgi:hypothetical protein
MNGEILSGISWDKFTWKEKLGSDHTMQKLHILEERNHPVYKLFGDTWSRLWIVANGEIWT